MQNVNRKEALGLAGAAGVALLLGRTGSRGPLAVLGTGTAGAAETTITPVMTEGPYWIDELLRRSDIRGNTTSATSNAGAVQPGVPLALTVKVLDADNGNVPLNGAHIDIWHANAAGLYSDESSQGAGGGTTGSSTTGQNFLRGYQVTAQDKGFGSTATAGQVGFKTIWPGWYTGRAIHIHVRVRTYDPSGTVVTNYTTQIFFSDADNNTVLSAGAPYDTRSPVTDPTTDETDNVLTASAKATNVVPVTGSVTAGYAATFTIHLSASAAASTGGSGVTGGAGGRPPIGAGATDDTVAASLTSARVVTAANGSRSVVLRLTAGETLTAKAVVRRGTATIGRATGQLTRGSHVLRVAIGNGAADGSATLRVTLADAAGNTTVVKRSLRVPASS